ncbi:MAG: endolytic transglycosylase MltG [Candidatus Kaiserbacteria bacterium]|nr:endolytic transglycosylase MltG [Candidatus Kaiserbacteria bacterium]
MYRELFSKYQPWIIAFVLAVSIVVGYRVLFAAPTDFVPETLVRIQEGASVPEIAQVLTEAHVVARPTLFRTILRVSGKSGAIQSGVYKFERPESVFARLTFIEGATTREMALLVAESFPDVQAKDFLAKAKSQEGYLFPDTYFFQPGATSASIIATLRANFDKKMASISNEVTESKHSLSDLVVMASLVEKEARTAIDRRMIAGILWNRIRLGMPLQVDAVFGYIFNKDTYSPSPIDLRVDSPYNTYTHTGLPPGPIDNPGLDALLAAATPTKTNNLFYLTGHDGHMYYATTYAGHQANLKKYLQ